MKAPEADGGPQSAHDLQSLFAAAVAAHQAGRFAEAERLYLEILAERPENVNLICNLGLLYREMKKPDEALAQLQRACALDPANFGVNLNIGAIHEDRGDLGQAEAVYRKALSLAPDDPRVLNNLGKVLFLLGDRRQALAFLQRAVSLYPEYPLAQNNLGVLLNSLGENDAALTAFKKALDAEPDNPATLYNMAGALSLLGDLPGAAGFYRKALDIDPDNGCARHMLAASLGDATARAPQDYVVDTFDRYSGHFDQQLVEKLAYDVPAVLAEAVRRNVGPGPFARCIDLGCGTGLSGLAFRNMSRLLIGVDLSSGMLARAREKQVYDALHQADIMSFLEQDAGTYDLLVATDVFIYIGDLLPVFQAVRKRAEKDACLAFSIETCDTERDYSLRVSGRYAQSVGYIRRLAGKCGLRENYSAPCNIRKEQGRWLPGHIFILRVA